jgi:hypothetical protein
MIQISIGLLVIGLVLKIGELAERYDWIGATLLGVVIFGFFGLAAFGVGGLVLEMLK